MDAIVVAFRVPNLFRALFGEGALTASYLPVFARLLRDDRTQRMALVYCHHALAGGGADRDCDFGRDRHRPLGLGGAQRCQRRALGRANCGHAAVSDFGLPSSDHLRNTAGTFAFCRAGICAGSAQHLLDRRRRSHCPASYRRRRRASIRAGGVRRDRRIVAMDGTVAGDSPRGLSLRSPVDGRARRVAAGRLVHDSHGAEPDCGATQHAHG